MSCSRTNGRNVLGPGRIACSMSSSGSFSSSLARSKPNTTRDSLTTTTASQPCARTRAFTSPSFSVKAHVGTSLRAMSPARGCCAFIPSLGDLVVDITIVPEGPLRVDDDNPARIRIGGGGQAANFCAWTASIGEPARLITRVGDDDSGPRLVGELSGVGVEVRPIYAPEPTAVIAVLVPPAATPP